LRASVFGPVIDARTERLSAKLQEIASKPRPDQERVMEVDSAEDKGTTTEHGASPDADIDEMQVDNQRSSRNAGSTSTPRAHPSRIEKKKARRKAKSSIVFAPSALHKNRKAVGKRKS